MKNQKSPANSLRDLVLVTGALVLVMATVYLVQMETRTQSKASNRQAPAPVPAARISGQADLDQELNALEETDFSVYDRTMTDNAADGSSF